MSHTRCEQQVRTSQAQPLFIHATKTIVGTTGRGTSWSLSVHTTRLLVSLDAGGVAVIDGDRSEALLNFIFTKKQKAI